MPVYGDLRGKAMIFQADVWLNLTTMARLVCEATVAARGPQILSLSGAPWRHDVSSIYLLHCTPVSVARCRLAQNQPHRRPQSSFLLLMAPRRVMVTNSKNQPHAELLFCYVSDPPKPHAHAYQPHRT